VSLSWLGLGRKSHLRVAFSLGRQGDNNENNHLH
jgi:hypothetical protein